MTELTLARRTHSLPRQRPRAVFFLAAAVRWSAAGFVFNAVL